MNKIIFQGMKFYAFVGHFETEKIVGVSIEIDLTLWVKSKMAQISDNIDDALNYQDVYAKICEVICQNKTNLIEYLAEIIIQNLFCEFPKIKKMKIYLRKINPQMSGQIDSVGVEIIERKTLR
ncbi:MAG: dihydroneopterin aldolase [Bacteroidales bacterium]|jgi:dihydroneopterin aldolase|nr:dihydroneopterin aldolase [Bacteroidales bacterium]